MRSSRVFGLFHFDNLDGDAIGALDHRRTLAAPRFDLLEELHALAFQPRDGLVEIGGAHGPVIHQLAACAHQTAAGPRADEDRDVVDVDAAPPLAAGPAPRERPVKRGGGRPGLWGW